VLRACGPVAGPHGRPYDTLEEVIGLRGSGQGSLAEFGIHYDELELDADGRVDAAGVGRPPWRVPTRMVLTQAVVATSWPSVAGYRAIGR